MDKESLGNFISEKRKEKEMTQKDLASLLNVSVATISKWECGVNFPDILLCEPLCHILGITLLDLFTQTSIANVENKVEAKIDYLLNDFIEITPVNNKKSQKSKKIFAKLNIFFFLKCILLLIALLGAIYIYSEPSFNTVYTDTTIKRTSDNTELSVYNLHICVKGYLNKQDIKIFSNLIENNWSDGVYTSVTPDIIHILFYDKPEGYKNSSYIAEVYLFHP